MKFKLFFGCPFFPFRLLCNQKCDPKPNPKPVLHDNLATNFRGWHTQIQLSVKFYWSSGQNIKLFHGRVARNRKRNRNSLQSNSKPQYRQRSREAYSTLTQLFLELVQNCRHRNDNNNKKKKKKQDNNKYDRGLGGATVQSSCRSRIAKKGSRKIFLSWYFQFFVVRLFVVSVFVFCVF